MKKAIVIIVLIILLAVVGIIYLFKINKSDNMKIAILEMTMNKK